MLASEWWPWELGEGIGFKKENDETWRLYTK